MESAPTLVRATLTAYLEDARSGIRQTLGDYFSRKVFDLRGIGAWGSDVALRLHEFSAGGKMLRGALVLLGADIFSRERDGEELKLSAAVELLQSALLIHDDIMDRDMLRRGAESVHAQYRRLGAALGVGEPDRFGESLGICAADVAIFAAFEIVASLAVPGSILAAVTAMCSREMTYVGAAQMQDVTFGHSPRAASEEEVRRLYLYKTGRYTFSLPLSLGGLLAGAPERSVEALSQAGERMGVLFQLKDDEIGLFGSPAQTGKPGGSDITEGKQTLYHVRLVRAASPSQRRRLARILGNQGANDREIEYVRSLVMELGVRDELSAEMTRLAEEAHALADTIYDASSAGLRIVHELIEYNLRRGR